MINFSHHAIHYILRNYSSDRKFVLYLSTNHYPFSPCTIPYSFKQPHYYYYYYYPLFPTQYFPKYHSTLCFNELNCIFFFLIFHTYK